MGWHSGEETEGHAASLLSGAPCLDALGQHSSAEEEDSGSQNCHPRTMGRGSCKAGDVTSTVSQSAVEVIPVQIFELDLKICPPGGVSRRTEALSSFVAGGEACLLSG